MKQLHEQLWEDFLKSVSAYNEGEEWERERVLDEARFKVIEEVYRANMKPNDISFKLTDEEKDDIEHRIRKYIASDQYIKDITKLSSWDKRQIIVKVADDHKINRWQLIWNIIRNK
tara:strand:- start:318 stop:665 length:348 start_codon:yes stop_codon:yes gene_type:complete